MDKLDVKTVGSAAKVNCNGAVYGADGKQVEYAGQKTNDQFMQALFGLICFSASHLTSIFYFVCVLTPHLPYVVTFDVLCPYINTGEMPSNLTSTQMMACSMVVTMMQVVVKDYILLRILPIITALYLLKPSDKTWVFLMSIVPWLIYVELTCETEVMVVHRNLLTICTYVALYLFVMLKSTAHKVVVVLLMVFPVLINVGLNGDLPGTLLNRTDDARIELFNINNTPVYGLISNTNNVTHPVMVRAFKLINGGNASDELVEKVLNETVVGAEPPDVMGDEDSGDDDTLSTPTELIGGDVEVTEDPVTLSPEGVLVQRFDPGEKVNIMDEQYKSPDRKRYKYVDPKNPFSRA